MTIVVMVISRLIDLTGKQFGSLTVIKQDGRNQRGQVLWLCKCSCGKTVTKVGSELRRGNVKTCGCKQIYPAFRKDLTGLTVNSLTVIKVAQRNPVKWLCKCKCGKETIVETQYLTTGNVKQCGCVIAAKKRALQEEKDLTGKQFNRLTVIRKVDRKNDVDIWLCKCACGNEKKVRYYSLINGTTKSCGCKQKEFAQNKAKDLSGMKFGCLTAIEIAQRNPLLWLCKCDCGNYTKVKTNMLTGNHTKSCGCLKKTLGYGTFHDYLGKRFGLLTVVELKTRASESKSKSTEWLCKCDCGNYKIIPATVLPKIISCGCKAMSRGELEISNLLQSYRINFAAQYKIKEINTEYRGNPKMDFAIVDNNKPIAFIEYQGMQHYVDVGVFGKYQRETTDIMKKEFCKKKNIPLFEIRYDEEIAPAVRKILSTLKLIPCQADTQSEGVTTIQ